MNCKRLLLLLILAFPISTLNAQSINFFKGSLAEAQVLAKTQHKLIYLLVDMGRADTLFSKGQSSPDVLKEYKSGFICLAKSYNTKDTRDIQVKYNISKFPCHIFLDQNGGLLLRTIGYRSDKAPYLEDIKKAKELAKQKTLSKYEAEYKAGNRKLDYLKAFISKYDELDIPVNQSLIDEYVNLLPVRALDDYETVSFVLQQGPILSSKAYKVIMLNSKLVDSLYKRLPLAKRLKMNNRIISYSMEEAKLKKDANLAAMVANFTSSTWNSTNWQKASYMRSAKLMEYFQAVNDTVRFVESASSYYNAYYMSLRDSIFKPEPTPDFMDRLSTFTSPVQPKLRRDVKDTVKMVGRIGSIGMEISNLGSGLSGNQQENMKAIDFATTLNNGAYGIFTSRTTRQGYLEQAVVWVRRSIELFPDMPPYYDTLAHLYYRQKKYDEAIRMQQKAVDIVEQKEKRAAEYRAKLNLKLPSLPAMEANNMYKVELAKMKSRTL